MPDTSHNLHLSWGTAGGPSGQECLGRFLWSLVVDYSDKYNSQAADSCGIQAVKGLKSRGGG